MLLLCKLQFHMQTIPASIDRNNTESDENTLDHQTHNHPRTLKALSKCNRDRHIRSATTETMLGAANDLLLLSSQ